MAGKRKIFYSYTTRVFVLFSLILAVLMMGAAYNLFVILSKNIDNNIFSKQQLDVEKNKIYINELFTTSITRVQDIASYMANYEMIPERNRRLFFENYLTELIKNDDKLYGVWVIFKPFSLDKYDYDYSSSQENITGQFVSTMYKIREHILEVPGNVDDYKKLEKYSAVFNSNQKLFLDAPIKDPNSDLTANDYIIRVVSPIIVSGKVVGIVGVDLVLNNLNEFFKGKGRDVFIMDNNMNIVFSNQSKYIDSKLDEIFMNLNSNDEFIRNFVTKTNLSSKDKLLTDQKSYNILNFIKIKDTDQQYGILLSYSDLISLNKTLENVYRVLFIPILIYLLLVSLVFILLRYLSKFFNDIDKNLNNLFKKDVKINFKIRNNREFKNIQSIIIKSRQTVEKYLNFTDLLIKETYDTVLKFEKDDILIESFEILRTKLKLAQKENEDQIHKQQKEAQISKSLAKINDIQRENINNLEILSNETIKFICDFSNAVQGGFYILNQDNSNPKLNLIAFYSYNRQVYKKSEIDFGDGLAGTCALEKKIIYTKVPKDYLEITSGLGQNPPNFILLLPLIHNDEVYGVIELAFLKEVEVFLNSFFEASSTIIASTIATSRNTSQTVKLLEDTKLITQKMQEKEKSLENQIKELELLRVKSLSQEQDLNAIMYSINKIEFYAEFDLRANVIQINNNLSERLQILSSDATLLTYYDIFMVSDKTQHEKYWKTVMDGGSAEYIMGVFLGKYNVWLKSILTPVYDLNNEIFKILFFAIDYTEIKAKEEDLRKSLFDLNEQSEQLSVQELEMDDFIKEYQDTIENNKNLKIKYSELYSEKQNIETTLEFIQTEFQKRASRSKRIELTLKNKIKLLEAELNDIKSKNKD